MSAIEVIGIIFIIALLVGVLTVLNSIDNSLCELVNDKRLMDAVKRKRGNATVAKDKGCCLNCGHSFVNNECACNVTLEGV